MTDLSAPTPATELPELRLVLEEIPDGVTVQDTSGRVVYANGAAARMLGLRSGAEVVDAAGNGELARWDLVGEDGAPLPLDRLPGRVALATGRNAEATVGWRVRGVPQLRWSHIRSTLVRDRDGAVRGAVNIFRDVTERRRADEATRFLAEAGELLAASLDYERTLARVAQLAVPRLGDWCMVYIAGEDGVIERLAVEHAHGRHRRVIQQLRDFPFDPDAAVGVPAVVRTGEAQLYGDADARLLASDVHGGERLAEELETLGICSWMCVPLAVRGRPFGAISLVAAESGRHFGPADLALASEIARRASLAVENARLYRDAQETAATLDTFLVTAPVGLAVWSRSLRYIRINDALAAINGRPAEEHLGRRVDEVIPELADRLNPILERVMATGEPLLDLEVSGETPAEPGVERHWLASYYPVRTGDGDVAGVGAIVSEITDRKRAESERVRLLHEAEEARERLAFLGEASRVLGASLDYRATLGRLARLAVPRLADWCTIDMCGDEGGIERVAVAHVDPERIALANRLSEQRPPTGDEPSGAALAIRTRESQLVPVITDAILEESLADDPELLEIIRGLGLHSAMVVPLVARERALGAITFISEDREREYDEQDLRLAEDLAARAATAVDNARLYEAAERRARAAEALEFVGEGVVLVDAAGVARVLNPTAERILGVDAAGALGRAAASAIPGWRGLAGQVRVGERPETVPLDVAGEERWLSISAVEFPAGTVYAFRDVTSERAIDRLKSEFVSTVSHELRTPLAAVYGAAQTLRRSDVALSEGQRDELLGVIASEAERLARIVNDILWASRLESGTMRIQIASCDPGEIARTVVQAARLHAPPGIDLSLCSPEGVPHVAADADKVRQVLANLVENAIKYSPDGGAVEVRVAERPGAVRFSVVDEGLGIPPAEHDRVFEKFFRLDPNLTRGVGGTGLGLYICRELVERMDGRIWVRSREGEGSTFAFELPRA